MNIKCWDHSKLKDVLVQVPLYKKDSEANLKAEIFSIVMRSTISVRIVISVLCPIDTKAK